MEPFGLLNFLQSLLPVQPPAPTQESEQTQTDSPSEPPPAEQENRPEQAAILSFFEEHERRAKKLKK